jgi:hypothetical protein
MIIARNKSQQNEAWVDPWTFVHVGFGLAFGLMEIGFWKSMAAASVYEVFEQVLERSSYGKAAFKTSGPERPGNVAVDLAVFAIGHGLGTLWARSGNPQSPAETPENEV